MSKMKEEVYRLQYAGIPVIPIKKVVEKGWYSKLLEDTARRAKIEDWSDNWRER